MLANFKFACSNCVQVLLLDENLCIRLAKSIRVFVLVVAFFIEILHFWLLAGFFEQVSCSNFVAAETHVKGGSYFTERNSLHLHVCLSNIVALQVSKLDRVFFSTRSEHHHSLEFLNICFL